MNHHISCVDDGGEKGGEEGGGEKILHEKREKKERNLEGGRN